MLSTTSSTGRPGATVQFVGSTHSGWSLHMPHRPAAATTGTPGGPQHRLVADAGQHQQVGRSQSHRRTTRFDRRSGDRPVGSDRVHADRATAGEAHPDGPRLGQQGEVGAAPARACRYAAPGPIRVPSTMLSGTAPTPDGTARRVSTSLRSASQPNPASLGGVDERSLCSRSISVSGGRGWDRCRRAAGPCRSPGRSRSRGSVDRRRTTPSPAAGSRRSRVGRPAAEVAAVDGA